MDETIAKNFSSKIWIALITFAITFLLSGLSGYISISGTLSDNKTQLAVLESKMNDLGSQIKSGIEDRYTGQQARYVNEAFDRRLSVLESKYNK